MIRTGRFGYACESRVAGTQRTRGTSSRRIILRSSDGGGRLQVVVDDLAAGGAPHAGVGKHVLQRRVEGVDALRRTGDERVDGDAHAAPVGRAVAVEDVEVAAQRGTGLVRVLQPGGMQLDGVDL